MTIRLDRRFETATPWSAEEVKKLAEMWGRGKSSREIGTALGRTRNMVIGKAHRLGINRGYMPKTLTVQSTKPKPKPKVKESNPKIPNFGATKILVRDITDPEREHAKPWEERKNYIECAYPLDINSAVMSCCAPTLGGIYCGFHHKLMYYKPRK